MSTSSSLKNVSVAQLQDAIARALLELTGCEHCSVRIDALEFSDGDSLTSAMHSIFQREKSTLRLEVELKHKPDYGQTGFI